MFEAGTGKSDITAFIDGIGMMGYGRDFNTVHGVETPLYARAVALKDPKTGKKVVFVNAEICFITISIKRGVMKRLKRHHSELGYEDHNVMLTAQHTHSGPGGYSHYGFYNLSIPGFVPTVYQKIVEGITEAILAADKDLQPAKISIHKGSFEPELEVGFNRSVKAYNQNPDVKPVSKDEGHLAIDREMQLLRIDRPDGSPMAAINWFGVHTTSLPNYNTDINSDNKGYASAFMENAMAEQTGNTDFVSIFAQGVAGDVSPNWIWDPKTRRTRGKFKNNLESAKFNGKLQFDKAMEIYEAQGQDLRSDINYELGYYDFSKTYCDPDFCNGKEGMRTVPATIGVDMLAGTKEGPGMPGVVAFFARRISRIMEGFERVKYRFYPAEEREKIRLKYRFQGKKFIVIETGERKVMATKNVKRLFIPGFVDGGIKTLKQHHRNGSLDDKPWSPQVLPLQFITLGSLAIATIPGEITTVAGRRLKAQLLEQLKPMGIEHVVISPYANAYSGYITTHEEYQLQMYEGGHTVFGEWTLAAFQTNFRHLANELLRHDQEQRLAASIRPAEFTEEDLRNRTFQDGMQMGMRKAKRKVKNWKANKEISA